MLSFPSSPVSGQYYTSSLRSWRYNGSTWVILDDPWIEADSLSGSTKDYFRDASNLTGRLTGLSALSISGNTVWHAGNDGANSTLDADLLDGLNSSSSATASTIVARDASANIYANYYNAAYGYNLGGVSILDDYYLFNDIIHDIRYSPGERVTFWNYNPNLLFNAEKKGYVSSWNSHVGITNSGYLWIPDTNDQYVTVDRSIAADPLIVTLSGAMPVTTNVNSLRIFYQNHGGIGYSGISFQVQRNDYVWVDVPVQYSTSSSLYFSYSLHTYAPYPTYTAWRGIRLILSGKTDTTNTYMYGLGLYGARAFMNPQAVSTRGDTIYGTTNTEVIRPRTTNTYDLGDSSFYWQNAYINGNITVNGTVDGRDISNDATILTTISGAYRNAGNLTGTISASVLPDTYVSQTSTNLGKLGDIALPSNPYSTTGWAGLPVGYASMIRNDATGAPLANYGYFIKVANRDTNGGWGGLWVGYNDGQNYVGRAGTNGVYATWDLLWSSANDGAGSTLDADLLDAQQGAYYLNAANLTGSMLAARISDFTEAAQDAVGSAIRSMDGVSGIYDDTKNTITYSGILATTAIKGVSSFHPSQFSVTGGHVTINSDIFTLDQLYDVGYDTAPDLQYNILEYDGAGWQPSKALTDHLTLSTNPHGTTYSDVGSPSVAQFTGHTGLSTIHYTQAQISITKSQVSDFSTYALDPANNLSDLNSKETARANIKSNFYMDDLAPMDGNGVWTSSVLGGGQTYQYDPRYNAKLRGNNCNGVVIVDNTTGTTIGNGAARYHNAAGCWLDNNQKYYFRIMAGQTGQALYRVGLSNPAMTATGDVTFGSYFEFNSSSGSFWYGCNAENSNRTKSLTNINITGVYNNWQWLAIEYSSTGTYFYSVTDSAYNLGAFVAGNLPSETGRSVRAFVQSVGNGGTYRAFWIDKFMYKLVYTGLPMDF